MISFVGHEDVRRELEQRLPPVALLMGPESIGKRTLTDYLLEYHKIKSGDSRRDYCLTTMGVRDYRNFCETAPRGQYKVVILRLDGAHAIALNALLKVLEEPPPTARFLLISSGPTLPTIMSRSEIYRMALLSDVEVSQVLVQQGIPDGVALRVASFGRGQVKHALESRVNETAKATVISILKSISEKDKDLFDRTMRDCDDAAIRLLVCWIREALTGRWLVFSQQESYNLLRNQTRLWSMYDEIGRVEFARPKLAARVALEKFF